MAHFVVDPIRKFEINGQIYPLKSVVAAYAVGNNQIVVANVAGQRTRIMGLAVQSQGGVGINGFYGFIDGFGGTLLFGNFFAPVPANPPDIFPVIDSGYCETSTNLSLEINIVTAPVSINLFYIQYTV